MHNVSYKSSFLSVSLDVNIETEISFNRIRKIVGRKNDRIRKKLKNVRLETSKRNSGPTEQSIRYEREGIASVN